MNQDEEVPTRVTRGALRRRSIDQDATPQNAQGVGASAAGSTPKKTASTTKKAPTLGAIKEGQSRPSTPVGGGRRRRMSETIDTPTTAANKLLQNLKDSEPVVGSGSGRQSRNTSLTLTEENVQELNAANESTGPTVRTRTPARLRASFDTLLSSTPQTAPAGVRRSTRRNSVTSEDGSVQSLPVTAPKTPIGRSLKDEPIVEEDSTGGDRPGSDSSSRNTPTLAGTRKAVSQSPRREIPSPMLTVKQEMTPPRGSVSPLPNSSARKPPNSTPRSKNVSFTDGSKQQDHQSGYPKTPTTPGTKFVLVGVNDLRNTPLINGTPKANAVIELNGSEEQVANVKRVTAGNVSPSTTAVGGTAPGSDQAPDATAKVETQTKKQSEAIAPSPVAAKADNTPTDSGVVPLNTSSSIPNRDRSDASAANDVSGIEALDSSVLEDVVNSSNNTSSNVNTGQTAEEEQFSKYWSHSVRGTTTKGIDAYSVRKQEESAEQEQKKLNVTPQKLSKTPEKTTQQAPVVSDQEDEDETDDDEKDKRHEFFDDEAMEVDGYQSGDSIDAEIREEMEENEIPDQGEDLGSDDTEEEDEDAEDEEQEHDSFIVTDDDEELDEDALLAGTGDDLSGADSSPVKTPKQQTPSRRRRIVEIIDDSEEEQEKAASMHPTPALSERKRSAGQLTTTDEEASPEKKPNPSVTTEDVAEKKEEIETSAADGQKGTPEKLDSSSGEAKTVPTPGSNASKSIEATPSKVDVSVQLSTKSDPRQSEQDCNTTVVMERSQEDVFLLSAKNQGEQSNSGAEKSDSVAGKMSRRSLPPLSVASDKEVGNAVARKSLPAGTKMQFREEATSGELHPSSFNLEASYQEEENDNDEGKQQQKEKKTATVKEQTVDAENEVHQEGGPTTATSDQAYFEALDIVEVEPQQPLVPVKPARKSLPPAPLISAQFYLGGSKKEKRNTLTGGEGATAIMGVTSTPHQKSSAKKDKQEAVSSNLVANPFAIASAKAKARLSMGLATEPEMSLQKVKNSRNSLPLATLDRADGDSNSKDISSVEEEPEGSSKQEQQQKLDEPEPMEVDEYVEEDGKERGAQGDDGEDEQPEEPVKPKTPKKKPKSLTEFDLESILTRCNEVVRADKERKKQLATLAQQKRDEKRRLRQLQEQQEKLEAGTTGDAEEQQQQRDDDDDTAADDTKPSVTTSANDEGFVGQMAGDDSSKKKKKRKKKVKNFVLEEMAELKRDRVSVALQRKMEAIEVRKQRKRERRAEKMKLLNKENGDDGRPGAADGIGAKLERVAKKKMKQKQQKQEIESAAVTVEELKQPHPPTVRVAVSAFSVFQQLQNGQTNDLQPAKGGPKSVVKQTTEEPVQKIAKKPEKKQPKHKVADVEPRVRKQPDEPTKASEENKSPPKENRQPPKAVAVKTPIAEDVIASKKPKKAEGMAAAESAQVQKAASESHLTGQGDTVVLSTEKLKRKQKKAAMASTVAVAVPGAVKVAAESLHREEIRKPKKQKNKVGNKMEVPVEEAVHGHATAEPLPLKELKKALRKAGKKEAQAAASSVNVLATKKPKASADKETEVASALREVRAVFEETKKSKKGLNRKEQQKELNGSHDDVVLKERPSITAANPPKKRKRDLLDGTGTPRPTKLRALQRADLGFVEETVTPEKTRLKRNFGFEELQATPKAVGFKVSSLLPTDDFRSMAEQATKAGKQRKAKALSSVPEPNRALPMPVWTRSGYFIEVPADESKPATKKTAHEEGKKKPNTVNKHAGGGASGYIALKGHEGFKLKTIRAMSNGAGVASSTAVKPHRIDPDTVAPSVLNFKRQQLLEKTAHLREKKGGGWM